eukprot:TRINITY_DN6952_c0_g1_i2.p1 TRINITY_DN6952_c0_g1~~TRINITY_DN6952_c0_g1_i2.p1  ORF type:complete len:617 (+),score=144.03 TRINITY_DN6952_c0_g1_i2:501-2351(+)
MEPARPMPLMQGWMKMETNLVGMRPESAVVYKERWFELYGRVLVHFAGKTEEEEMGYPGDLIHLDDADEDPGLAMRMVLEGRRIVVLHTASPSEWVRCIAAAAEDDESEETFIVKPARETEKFVLNTVTNLTESDEEHTLSDLQFSHDTRPALCSFGSIRMCTLKGYRHPVAARLIITRYLATEHALLNNTIHVTSGCPFINTVVFQTSTENKLGMVQSWVVSEWLPDPLAGNVGEDRARHQVAQLAIAINYIESINMAPTHAMHPQKIRVASDGTAVLTGLGISTVWTPMRRLDPSIEMYHRRPSDWWGLAGILYFLVFGEHPRWALTNPDGVARLVLPPFVSSACCEVLEAMLTLDVDATEGFSLQKLKSFAFFSELDWAGVEERSLPVPPPRAPSPAFQVLDLEPPTPTSMSTVHSPEHRYHPSDGVLPVPPRTTSLGRRRASPVKKKSEKKVAKKQDFSKGTLASDGRKVESMRKNLALRKRVMGGQPPMRYASPVRTKPVRMVDSLKGDADCPAKPERTLHSSRSRNCAMDLLPSHDLHVVKHHDPNLEESRKKQRAYSSSRRPRPKSPASRHPPRADYALLPMKDLPDPRKPSGYNSSPIDIRSPPRHYN